MEVVLGFVRTIKGDVSPDLLGCVNCHDHLIRTGAGEVYLDKDHLLDSVDKAVEEASYFVQASKRWSQAATIIDMCPADCGRDVLKLVEVNNRIPGLHIVVATGFHREHVYLETKCHWVSRYSVNQIADLLIADIEEGVDAHDYSGPIVERTPYKAGVIKFASAYGQITEWEKKTQEAVAIAAKVTGAPINTHTTFGTAGLEQAKRFIELGVDPDQVAIGHIQRNADVYYLAQILKLGVYLELDGTYRIKYLPDSARVTLVRELGKQGFGKRLLLGTDSGKRSYQKAYGAVSGIDYDPSVFAPRLLDEGFDPDYVDDLLMYNAQTFFQVRR
ncbi:phosphotriesterase [Tropheryma whipplei]|uniref:phosphotriesterase family protein n=1 Tax=Tropheryma whipplei TaxID=2039 RepID=UPI0004B9E34C|nr:phosphotriesterase-related protein [Tropheryma whipplei]MCO8190531.1 phosphotriesterase-related protein [Tropheryma whipplei]